MSKSTGYRVPLDWHIIDLADGRTAGPGDEVSLSEEDQIDPHNKLLIDEGRLMELDIQINPQEKSTSKSTSKTKTEEGS